MHQALVLCNELTYFCLQTQLPFYPKLLEKFLQKYFQATLCCYKLRKLPIGFRGPQLWNKFLFEKEKL